MKLIDCTFDHAPEILAIYNDAILHTTALYEYQPRTMTTMETWFATKRAGHFPILGAIDATSGALLGFATYGTFRAFPAFKYSVEHSVYLRPESRGQGLGQQLLRALVARAQEQNYHALIGGIDSTNTASIRLHLALGFTHCASFRQVGYKFGRWLDAEFYQLLLPTPAQPTEELPAASQ